MILLSERREGKGREGRKGEGKGEEREGKGGKRKGGRRKRYYYHREREIESQGDGTDVQYLQGLATQFTKIVRNDVDSSYNYQIKQLR